MRSKTVSIGVLDVPEHSYTHVYREKHTDDSEIRTFVR